MKHKNNSRLVYSTEHGKMCPKCEKPADQCICKKTAEKPKTDGIVRLGIEKKGRKGKGVTLITGIPADGGDLKTIAKTLKQKCGSGGTVKNHTIEIQGDHRDVLMTELKKMGYAVKKVGG